MKGGLCAAARLTGGEPRHKNRTCFWLRRSCRRVFRAVMAVRSETNAGKLQRASAGSDRFARSLQCASREPYRRLRRPVAVVGAERPSRLCVLINSILPGAFPRDQAGEILEKSCFCSPQRSRTVPGPHKQPNPFADGVSTLVDASVHEAAHTDVHCHAQRQERKQHRRSAITH